MQIMRGQIVRSLAGHDRGDLQVVLFQRDGFVYTADGQRRTIEKPKKKKPKHLAPTAHVLLEENLSTNRQIRRALREYREQKT